MLTFNDLLDLEGIDTAKVRLVRHQDPRLGAGRLYEAWRNDRDAFEGYQCIQARDVFPVVDLLASFVVTEAGKTVFVGMYRVDGVGTCPPGSLDPLLKHDTSGSGTTCTWSRTWPTTGTWWSLSGAPGSEPGFSAP